MTLTDHPGYDPEVRVQFYGQFDGVGSIPNVCRQWVRVLAATIDGFAAYNLDPSSSLGDSTIEHLHAWNPRAPVAIFYGFPYGMPPRLRELHEVLIGAFVCETDRIPVAWVNRCETVDLVVVPSHFCRRAFERSHVRRPVEVVPHGIEDEYTEHHPKQRSSPFTFFNTFPAQSFPQRKGAEELIRCFARAFEGRTDVVLRLRTQDTGLVRQWVRQYGAREVIRVEAPEPLTTRQFAQLYGSVHCTVHPSKGEGFGLIPLQSIACATPVIAPASTGMADYLDDKVALLLRTTGWEPGIGWDGQRGLQQAVDEEHLVELLRRVEADWEAEYARVAAVAPEFRRTWAWPSVLAPFVERLRDLADLSRPSASHFPRVITPCPNVSTAGGL